MKKENAGKKAAKRIVDNSSRLDKEVYEFGLMALKELATGTSHLADIVYHPIAKQFNKNAQSLGKMGEKQIDNLTGGASEANTFPKKVAKVGLGILFGGGAGKIIGKGSSSAVKYVKEFLKPTKAAVAAGVASEGVQHVKPDSKYLAPVAGMATPILASLGKKAIKSTPIRSYNRHTDLNRIRQNPNALEELEKRVAKNSGADDIMSKDPESMGDIVIKGINKVKNDNKARFKKDFDLIDSSVDNITKGGESSKKFVDVSDTARFAEDHLNKLTDHNQKIEFIASPLGKQLVKLRGIKADHPSSLLKKLEKNIAEKPAKEVKVAWHDARYMQRGIQNALSKAGEYGNMDQGQLRSVAKGLNDSMGKIFEGHPKMEKHWRKTNAEYINFASNVKPHINKYSKHKPTLGSEGEVLHKGNPVAAFEESMAHPEQAQHHSIINQGLDEADRSAYAMGRIRKSGLDEGLSGKRFNPTKSRAHINALEDTPRNMLMGSLEPEARARIERQYPLLKQIEYEKNQPIRKSVLGSVADKYLPDVFPNKYASTKPKTIDNIVQALEHEIAKGEPKTAKTSSLPSSAYAVNRVSREPEEISSSRDDFSSAPDYNAMPTEKLLQLRAEGASQKPDYNTMSTEQLLELRAKIKGG